MSENHPPRASVTQPGSSTLPLSAPGASRSSQSFLVVGIGASSGGLAACREFIGALPASTGAAFILVQHLDPSHESMMVNLLADHTSMTVRQAKEGMQVEPEQLYIIPPGSYLSVRNGALHLSLPQAHRGARLPFDFLLSSLAQAYGARAIGVVLSGNGGDGSIGLKAVKEKYGLVIAQDPDEAEYDGMPRSAIMTGAVDFVLPVSKIPEAIIEYNRRMVLNHSGNELLLQDGEHDWLQEIIHLLRKKTVYDFTLYKRGTLRRRVERRRSIATTETADINQYIKLLRHDARELELLANDLFINVTNFFRDPKVFEVLSESIIPELVRLQPLDQPLRVWVAGCSTGEEAYSFAILFREQITASQRNLKLQIFASDVDSNAVACAREGRYSETIAADVSPARLARFFLKEDHGYRISPELRSTVIFSVQDVLADPPFSRLDLVSCRNLLIYLRAEAQARVIALFHFSLRESGLLVLGSAEAIGNIDNRFEVVSKSERIYRHIGRSRLGGFGMSMNINDGMRILARPAPDLLPSRQSALAELCRRLVIEAYAPAAVLINAKHECVYSLGPTDRYLRVAPGYPTHNLFAMASPRMLARLRLAIEQARRENARIIIKGIRINHDGQSGSFSIAVQPVLNEGEALLLICFIDEPLQEHRPGNPGTPEDLPRIAELERELEVTRAELQSAIRNLDILNEEQKAINEEALSVNEEYQSTNEELLTSKEELQSLNEELTALNSQLHETLERQRTTSNDLQNVLYSTDVATLFLDANLNIRFFTPATKLVFSVISSDIGRPLADLNSLAADGTLLADARAVLQNLEPLEREIEAQNDVWFIRRILPYRTHDDEMEGVVITFTDITERKHIARTLEAAKHEAELANIAKSRFLAAVSHDLRQPLQSLSLLQGLLFKMTEEDSAKKLLVRLDETLSFMSGMLNTLLDINQIESGTIHTEMVTFPINDLLRRLRDEFSDHANAKGLTLSVVSCGLSIRSDPNLLEQMIRNLLSNALKYTQHGKVLLGCRRHKQMLSIEIWDTGIGIPETEIHAIFDEYHQVDNTARERNRGLGLGLSIVQRLANLLGHQVRVLSRQGRGSVFVIEVMRSPSQEESRPESHRYVRDDRIVESARHLGKVLIVEDDTEIRELIELTLNNEGHQTASAPDGVTALAADRLVCPDVVLADYNLPNGLNGLQLATKLREKLNREIPVIILTGDISAHTLHNIALHDCVPLNKPVRPEEITQAVQQQLAARRSAPRAEIAGDLGLPTVFIIEDDSHVRDAMRDVLEEDGRIVETYSSGEEFLKGYRPGCEACLVIDAYLPGMTGLELLQRFRDAGHLLPAIMITGNSDVSMAVQAMKAGAADFIEKPIGRTELLDIVTRALEQSLDSNKLSAWMGSAVNHIASLTPRQREIMERVFAGQPSKNIAADLGISQRTVENHRASIMKKTNTKSIPALVRLVLAASGGERPLVQDEFLSTIRRKTNL